MGCQLDASLDLAARSRAWWGIRISDHFGPFGPRTSDLGPRTSIYIGYREWSDARSCCQRSFAGSVLQAHTAMEGAHKRQRQTSDLLVGDEGEAGEKRQRVQRGVGASGRRGQATQIRAAPGKGISAQVRQDVAKAMQAGSALVQASLEHLETAERSWDKWVREHGIVIKNYPTEVQVLSYMAQMSRTRQRECLAQRGKRRSGGQKGSVRNYVSEMGNNRWPHKYPAFARLEPLKQKQYWSSVFTAYAAMYKSASQPAATEEDEERAEQLVAQARGPICLRIRQLRDLVAVLWPFCFRS